MWGTLVVIGSIGAALVLNAPNFIYRIFKLYMELTTYRIRKITDDDFIIQSKSFSVGCDVMIFKYNVPNSIVWWCFKF